MTKYIFLKWMCLRGKKVCTKIPRNINVSHISATRLTNPAKRSLICHLLIDEHTELRSKHEILLLKTFSSAAKSPGKHFVKQLHSAWQLWQYRQFKIFLFFSIASTCLCSEIFTVELQFMQMSILTPINNWNSSCCIATVS